MEIRRYTGLLLHRWWLLLLGTALFAGAGFLVARSTPRVYRATATLFVNQASSPGTISYSDALLNEQLVKTYSQMITQPVVLDIVRQRLQLTESVAVLDKMVNAHPVVGTQLLEIVVDASSPEQARDVANAVASVFIEQQTPFLPDKQAASALRVAQPALLPASPIWPRIELTTAVAGLFGGMLAFAFAALLEYLDDTIKSPEDLERVASLASMGAITRISGRRDASGLVAETNPRGPAAEAYRLVRTNLEFASFDRPLSTILLTSAGPGDGKSTTTANLAVTLAQTGKRVVIIDADLRKPSQHKLFATRNGKGLTNLLLCDTAELIDWATLNSCITQTRVPGLRLLTSGPLPPNPAELLGSTRMTYILDRLKAVADIILIDSPPAINLADPVLLASRVEGTLLVVDAQRTRADSLRGACAALSKSGTVLLGAVLNKVERHTGGYYYHYYGGDGDRKEQPAFLPTANGVSRQPVARQS